MQNTVITFNIMVTMCHPAAVPFPVTCTLLSLVSLYLVITVNVMHKYKVRTILPVFSSCLDVHKVPTVNPASPADSSKNLPGLV